MTNELIVLVLAIFLLAGMVKGVIGLGLPTVSLAALTVADRAAKHEAAAKKLRDAGADAMIKSLGELPDVLARLARTVTSRTGT